MTIGEKIKSVRKERRMAQKQLAEKCGLNRNSIYKYEKNETVPTVTHIEKIAVALDVPLSYLIGCEIKDATNSQIENAKIKKVFICSQYRANEKHTTEDNITRALYACKCAISRGYAPYAPHLYLPRCLDDNDPTERALGIEVGKAFLASCDEVWQWGATVSEGMALELDYASKLGIPIKVFNSIGIPREEWNDKGI